MKELPGIRLGLGSSVCGEEIFWNLDHLEGWEMLGSMFGGSILLLVERGYDVDPYFAVRINPATTYAE